jgi:hypothetical protein
LTTSRREWSGAALAFALAIAGLYAIYHHRVYRSGAHPTY